MYWGYPVAYRQSFQPVWQTTFQQSLAMIREAVQDERHDELFYEELIRLAPTQAQQEIITSIREDERGHNRMFRSMYKELTGQDIAPPANVPFQKPASYVDGLTQALFGELSAVEKYRAIWSGLPAGVYQNTVLGIILDEQKHATKYNYLLLLNQMK
ncbi:rubrerythrin [Paenibacillus cellulosilyticus]|uniref:Rubrerythrin n=1 Tax=Paenibacillus cellulosilyticus TaxID=375489 RepID=A0A2V2YYG3_9BACL|nr:ferritin-like domain-containing protein [Paenibacillus cellulosilyticus]PWW04772.1 rubrerythrin [Paenibacillus cellulosilyticus]QKS45895.1 ferritin-like domain-containing protein [Paenibacillus cellulosilyticus]